LIVIGSTRKPTQRIRSFIKELVHVIPHATRITRGKQALSEFLEEAHTMGASKILLVGGFHGNPGRLGFLEWQEDKWVFIPPTILLKSVTLLREQRTPVRSPKRLYVFPETAKDQRSAHLLAQAIEVSLVDSEELPFLPSQGSILRVALRHRRLDFVSLQQDIVMGPSMVIKHFLHKPMGDSRRW
jgi:U3 small nucleolar ribonucleoprotein protein IMP4